MLINVPQHFPHSPRSTSRTRAPAHIGIRAPAPCPTRATPAPQHFPRPRNRAFWNPRSRAPSNSRSPCAATLPAPAQPRILESALPRPVQFAQPLRHNTSRARAIALLCACPLPLDTASRRSAFTLAAHRSTSRTRPVEVNTSKTFKKLSCRWSQHAKAAKL